MNSAVDRYIRQQLSSEIDVLHEALKQIREQAKQLDGYGFTIRRIADAALLKTGRGGLG